MRWRVIRLVIFLALSPLSLFAQKANQQVWLEYLLNYAFAKSYNFENIIQYSTLLDSPRWRSLEYNPLVQRSFGDHFDIMAGVTFIYTNQIAEVNTFEIRPAIGGRIHFTPNRRILTQLYVRIEQRNIKNPGCKKLGVGS